MSTYAAAAAPSLRIVSAAASPSALLKDCFWSRMIKKHKGMPSVSQVVHFPANAAVGLKYNSILRRLQPLTYLTVSTAERRLRSVNLHIRILLVLKPL